MTSLPVPMCYSCVHQSPNGLACTAFPDGIPLDILDSETDHRLPYTGDNDIRFEQDPAMPQPDFEGLGFAPAEAAPG